MLTKITFYGYLFLYDVNSIIRYDILPSDQKKLTLKCCVVDPKFKNPTDEITVKTYDTLEESIEGIISRFRNCEITMRAYRNLRPAHRLNGSYKPFITNLARLIREEHIHVFSIFGRILKYSPQDPALALLRSMGYLFPITTPPHLYVLEDVMGQEEHSHTSDRQ